MLCATFLFLYPVMEYRNCFKMTQIVAPFCLGALDSIFLPVKWQQLGAEFQWFASSFFPDGRTDPGGEVIENNVLSHLWGKKLSLRKGRWVKMVTALNGLYHTDFYLFFIFSILKTVGEKDAFASS